MTSPKMCYNNDYCDEQQCWCYRNAKADAIMLRPKCECEEDLSIYENHDCTLSPDDGCFSCEKLFAKYA